MREGGWRASCCLSRCLVAVGRVMSEGVKRTAIRGVRLGVGVNGIPHCVGQVGEKWGWGRLGRGRGMRVKERVGLGHVKVVASLFAEQV